MKCKLSNDNFRSDYVTNLLRARGVHNLEAFLHPTKDLLNEPTLLENMVAGANYYLNVVKQDNKHILIVVDSDNDGYTSAAIIYQYTKRLNPNCKISYWLHEGKQHGLQDHIDRLMTDNVEYDLIILPDSSSNDVHYHDMLAEIHIPCLILDHHLTDTPLSDNAIVINNQLSPKYPNKELTGAGVVYQFCRYIDQITGNNWADDYLDLAAWGIIGDMGSVLELENRYIITAGLKNIKNPFLKTLMEKQGYSITGSVGASWEQIASSMNPTSVAFYIVPLVNAEIRVGTMEEKERLFLAFVDGEKLIPSHKRGAKGTMEVTTVEVARECTNARARQNRIKDAAVELLEAKIYKYDLLENRVLFVRLDDEDFPAELNGLIAMQLAARFKRPTIVARLNNEGYIRGSARGLNESELTDFKQFLTNSHYFEYAQGHANAFGCSIKDQDLRAFHEYANKALNNIDFGETFFDVNFERFASDNDIGALITELAQYDDIWGQFNPTPLIYVHNININANDIRIMGKNADTVKIEHNGIAYMQFHAKEFIQDLHNFQEKYGTDSCQLDVVGRANLNNWMGHITPQLFIEGYELKQKLISF